MTHDLIVYRYDPREFDVGSTMLPDLKKEPDLIPKNVLVETRIGKQHPEFASIRKESLYTWRDFKVMSSAMEAKQRGGSASYFHTRHFYELEVSMDDVLFIGDLNYHTLARKNLEDEALCSKYLTMFAEGKCFDEQDSPRIEILVTKAIVLKRYDT